MDRLDDCLGEAVLDPSRWSAFVERAAIATGSRGATLLRVDGIAQAAISTDSMERVARRYFDEGWNKVDHRLNGLPAMRETGVAVDQDFTTEDQFRELPFYGEFLAEFGLRWFAGVGFHGAGTTWCLSLQRGAADGPFERAEQARLALLAPGLHSAAVLTAAIDGARLDGMAEALDLVGRAAVVLARDGTVLRANAAFDELQGSGVRVSQGRLAFDDPAAAREMARATSWAPRPLAATVTARAHGRTQMVIHVVPLPGRTRQAFSGGAALVLVARPRAVPTTDVAILRIAFGLTPSEARLAVALGDGTSLARVAERSGIAYETARTHLKAVLCKVDVRGQAELVRVLCALQGPSRARDPSPG